MSNKKIYRAIGLMSGTSMDGIDLAIIESDGEAIINRQLFDYQPYSDDFKSKLRKLIIAKSASFLEIKTLEQELTILHSKLILETILKNNIKPEDIDIIGFHGHTIYHNQQKKITWQIGDPFLLAEKTKIKVVANFRNNDMALNGKGAPLVPIYHFFLLKEIKQKLAIINIGGVSNLTYFESNNINSLTAMDICFGNALFDDLVLQKLGKNFDDNGEITRAGLSSKNINQELIVEILNNKIFSITKSASFDRNDFTFIYEKIKNMSLEESLATLAIIYSKQLIAILKSNKINPQEIILCGGGRKNLGIKMAINQEISNFNKEQNSNILVKDSDEYQINGDAIEAEAFAFLAIRSIKKLPISFKNTSGIDIDSCKGGGFYNFN